MAVQVQLSHDDAARTVDALHLAAELEDVRAPLLAKRYRAIADSLGDALETLPLPSDVERRRGERLRHLGV